MTRLAVGKPEYEEARASSKPWTNQQKRCLHRLRTILTYWQSRGYQVRRVDLTTAPGGFSDALAYNHKRLLQALRVKFGFKGVEYFVVRTDEGNGVLHCVWAWKPPPGRENQLFYIPKRWLSETWEKIHGAKITYIRKYKAGEYSKRRVSCYFADQYVSNQRGFVRFWWSWERTFGFKLPLVWEHFRNYYGDYCNLPRERVLSLWDTFVRGDPVPMKGGVLAPFDLIRYLGDPLPR